MFSYLSDTIRLITTHKNHYIFRSLQANSIHTYISYVDQNKRAYKTCPFHLGTKGSATVEASLILPLFIFSMLVIVSLCGCVRTRHAVYEGLQETAQYLAEYEYLYHMIGNGINIDIDTGVTGSAVDVVTAYTKFIHYIDDHELIEKYVSGGMAGLIITRAEYDPEDGYVYIEVQYKMKANVPLFGELEWDVHERIRQKAYMGYQNDRALDETQYVYITENASVYHTRRSCYHISLSIQQIARAELSSAREYLTPCDICSKYGSDRDMVYITDEGKHYHSTISCSGLKRTVYRVKAEDYPYLPACSNCG